MSDALSTTFVRYTNLVVYNFKDFIIIKVSRRTESGVRKGIEYLQHYFSEPSQPDDWQPSTLPSQTTALRYSVDPCLV